ncbi:hypothetical protein F2Q70_00023410 [Brassica cretica]|uniref:Uncharacterized protein n=1 Tax=Brassica cretica TaxID=69181 RepID=A0A8S9GIA1_BRACR|nr:hypothetical protein F2Q70_00023410 [Brassica cretica]
MAPTAIYLFKSNKLSTQIERVNHIAPSFHQIERFNQTLIRKSTSIHHLIKLRVIHIQLSSQILYISTNRSHLWLIRFEPPTTIWATQLPACNIWFVVSGLLALLKVEGGKIGAGPYDGYLRTLVIGIKLFIVRLGVKREDYELSSRNLTLCELLYPLFDTMPRDVKDSALGLGQDLGSRLIRLVWLESSISPRTNFKPPGSADQNFWISFIVLLSLCRIYERHLYEMAKSV